MSKLRTTIIASGLSALLAITAFGPAQAAPTAPGIGIENKSDIQFVDWRRRHGNNNWHGNDRNDWHSDRSDGHRRHNGNAGAIIGGLAVGAIIGGAIANGNNNRYRDNRYYYDDRR